MWRRILIFLKAASFVLPIAAVAVWICGYTRLKGEWFWHRRDWPVYLHGEQGDWGLRYETCWHFALRNGLLVVAQSYEVTPDGFPYRAPTGFPADPDLVREYREFWDDRIGELNHDNPSRGHKIETNWVGVNDDEGHWWSRGFDATWCDFPKLEGDFGFAGNYRAVGLPAWSLVLLAGPLPGVSLISSIRRRRRIARRLCLTCGYDLRATQHRCPECGAAIG